MKSRLKNSLKNEVEIAGRSVSVLVLVAVFLAGSGGAAILTSFGTVSGSANIDQSFTVDGETGKNAEVRENVALTGGESVVTNHRFNNSLNRSVEINVTSDAPKELSLGYRFVDDLVATTEYRNFDDDQANITGDMKSEFAYNPLDNKVGVHAYGQTVYKSRSSSEDAESYAGFVSSSLNGSTLNATMTGTNSLKLYYSEGRNHSSEVPGTIIYEVITHIDVDGNGESGEKWILRDSSLDFASGESISIDSRNGDSFSAEEVYKKSNSSATALYSQLESSSSIRRIKTLVSEGSDNSRSADMWYYELKFNRLPLIEKPKGNFTRTFDPGVTEGAVIADAKINAYGTGISYGSRFDPITE